MKGLIRVAILEDHPGIVDGYRYRLERTDDLVLVGVAADADALDRLLADQKPDVLLLDLLAPESEDNGNPYALFPRLARWHQSYPSLAILVVSVFDDRALIRAVMDAGARGYILKDDWTSIEHLASVIRSVARGGVHFSAAAYQKLHQPQSAPEIALTVRQREVLCFCCAHPNATTLELAGYLGVEHSTCRSLLSEIYNRLGVRNRSAALLKARDLGLITPWLPLPPLYGSEERGP